MARNSLAELVTGGFRGHGQGEPLTRIPICPMGHRKRVLWLVIVLPWSNALSNAGSVVRYCTRGALVGSC